MSIENIVYKTHPRSRRLTLRVTHDLKVVVTIPRLVSKRMVERFIHQHKEWITKQLEKIKFSSALPIPHTTQEIHRAKITARQLVLKKLLQFNEQYNFYYASVSIRSQRTRWGSCSRRQHLSFNYQIALLPEELADYIVIHELCHLKEMNHSKNFWALVAQTIPDYRDRRRQLKKIHLQ